ncbi:catalase family peroxidase [Mycolicibacterium goodii]|uniref:Catalase-related peroxidase n=1 Tax=Mycolicibacterium goodii TaxID=134601 RepID=A0A0K0X9E7_MYCGD|nr:catalase [Mycolicibacterium goodii]
MNHVPDFGKPVVNRRRVLLGAAAIGGFLAVDLGAVLFATNTIGTRRLTPKAILDALAPPGGRPRGYRANHAKGVAVSGYFDSNGNAEEISRAAGFAPGRTAVLGRFSFGGANPHVADDPSLARGLGLAFDFPSGRQWRTAMLNLPVFPDKTPQGFYERTLATKPLASTGKPDPEAMPKFLAAHPETKAAMDIIKATKPSAGFADSTFRSLMAFYFVDDQGVRTPVRWSLEPMQEALPAGDGDDRLFDALVRQMRAGPLRWRLLLTVGEPQDPVADATVPWPAGRRVIDAGTITLDTIETDGPGNGRDINFDPLVLPDGIEPSEDPMLSARSAVYAASYRLRAGETPSIPPQVQVDKVEEVSQ